MRLLSKLFLLTIPSILFLGCDDSIQLKTINDKQGIIFQVDLPDPMVNGENVWIGMTAYYPDGRVLFMGQDSIGIQNYYPDGAYRIDVTLFARFVNFDGTPFDQPVPYNFRIRGIGDKTEYLYQDRFVGSDSVYTVKSSATIEKAKNKYISRRLK